MHFETCTASYVSLRLYVHAGRSDLSARNSTSAAEPVPVCLVCLNAVHLRTRLTPDSF